MTTSKTGRNPGHNQSDEAIDFAGAHLSLSSTLAEELMNIPDHIWRHPTRAAIASLADRFELPNTPEMQDWEYEVADPKRIDEFLAAYNSGELNEDERFILMETIIQSFEESEKDLSNDPKWTEVLEHLDQNHLLHGFSIWYWSVLESNDIDEQWKVTDSIRVILGKHKKAMPTSRTEQCR